MVNKVARSSGAFHGTATWFRPNVGACGEKSSEADYMTAMNTPQYNFRWPLPPECGDQKQEEWQESRGQGCPSCRFGDLDLSPSAFKALGKLEDGVLPIDWQWTWTISK
ncbi:hypothetical protein Pst134EA_031465 [Puccinia striiformis f. sp. tritici]|uniref:uncharacterized protein n=1 Tax=Puccinia striiformis f. sp. tritici TaxID=168172 RepID=UPI002008D15C|nr:uncharacterized protein Pst134EA_031465 [Puccinia striiformis f. sp. tritici]KAH9445289.1 hypothetical protein Pst134EA_031465 [Puccinia striiformis f. sp. tritici]